MLVDGRQADVASGASYDSSGASGDPNPQASPSSHSGGVDQRKLVILGLPWSTVEATLLVRNFAPSPSAAFTSCLLVYIDMQKI